MHASQCIVRIHACAGCTGRLCWHPASTRHNPRPTTNIHRPVHHHCCCTVHGNPKLSNSSAVRRVCAAQAACLHRTAICAAPPHLYILRLSLDDQLRAEGRPLSLPRRSSRPRPPLPQPLCAPPFHLQSGLVITTAHGAGASIGTSPSVCHLTSSAEHQMLGKPCVVRVVCCSDSQRTPTCICCAWQTAGAHCVAALLSPGGCHHRSDCTGS